MPRKFYRSWNTIISFSITQSIWRSGFFFYIGQKVRISICCKLALHHLVLMGLNFMAILRSIWKRRRSSVVNTSIYTLIVYMLFAYDLSTKELYQIKHILQVIGICATWARNGYICKLIAEYLTNELVSTLLASSVLYQYNLY